MINRKFSVVLLGQTSEIEVHRIINTARPGRLVDDTMDVGTISASRDIAEGQLLVVRTAYQQMPAVPYACSRLATCRSIAIKTCHYPRSYRQEITIARRF